MNNFESVVLLIIAIIEFVFVIRTHFKRKELERRITALLYNLDETMRQKNILLAKIEDIKELFED